MLMFRFVIVAVILLATTPGAYAFDVEVRQKSPGGAVEAKIVYNGKVGIHNDLLQRSESVNVPGTLTVNLGTPSKNGFYFFDFFTAGDLKASRSITIFVDSAGAGRSKPLPVSSVDAGVWNRFTKNMTAENLGAAWKKFEVSAWLASNAVDIGKTGTACLVWGAGTASGIGAPAAQLSLSGCVYGNVGLSADFAANFFVAYANLLLERKTLTAGEAQSITALLKGGSFALSTAAELVSGNVLSPGKQLNQRLANLLKTAPGLAGKAVELNSEKYGLTMRVAGDETSKIIFLLELGH